LSNSLDTPSSGRAEGAIVIASGVNANSSPDRVLVIHAHPDDEVFATAAATIALARQGCQVFLRVGTGGEAGLLAAYHGDLTRARATREVQLTRSCELLGIAAWDYLAGAGRWIDTGYEGRQTLADEDPAVVAAAVRRCIDHLEPMMVLTVDRAGLTGHPDHIAVHKAVRIALATPGWRPGEAWGALLLHQHVAAAYALAKTVVPNRPVGSGLVRGRADDAVERVMSCSIEDAHRRRIALDELHRRAGYPPAGQAGTAPRPVRRLVAPSAGDGRQRLAYRPIRIDPNVAASTGEPAGVHALRTHDDV
jgi:LmbE family N-acetylglucosaminyl deacetylase